MLPTHKPIRASRLQLLLWLSLLICLMPRDLIASSIPSIWKELYKELNDGARPAWKARDEAHAWGVSEKDRLEPVVLEILRGQRADADWSGSVLFVARVIPTNKIRDVLLLRIQEVVQEESGNALQRMSGNASGLSRAIDVFAKAGDIRILPTVLLLMDLDGQEYEVLEHCALALRTVGNGASLQKLRSIPLRQRDIRFERLCALTEKIIEARQAGQDIFGNTEQELRVVTAQFVRAIEQRDFTAFAAVQPYDFRLVVDEEEFTRRILPQPEWGDILRALKEVAGREEFQIDRDDYQATLIVEGCYQFTYILEIDGWKIFGPIRVGP